MTVSTRQAFPQIKFSDIMSAVISGIQKKYGKKQVLKEISFEISFSRCIGILGVNGSGKSTLLSILAGIQRADSGKFLSDGVDLLQDSHARERLIGYVPQGTPLIEELTAKDNLLLWYSKKDLQSELESGVLAMLGISDFLNVTVSKLSGGMKKRLSIGCSMAGHPNILLLDEPSAAIDFVCKQNIAEYLSLFRKNGGAVVIATHDVSELQWCDDMYILKDGILIPYEYDGDLKRLAEHLQ